MEELVIDASLRRFYAGKRVLLTGHTGFKGAWLTIWLAELGAQVHGYALEAPTSPSLFQEANVASLLASQTIADVRDGQRLTAVVGAARPEIVFHLAAQPLVRLAYEQPRLTWETNVIGTLNLLEAIRQLGGTRVCQVVTTDKCYDNREWVYAYRENDPLGGYDPYSSSKAATEVAVSSWRSSFFSPAEISRHGLSLSSARAGNVIGGGDWARDRIVPDAIRSLQQGQSVPVRNPQAIRPWQHVLEPLRGYLTLAMCQWQDPARFADAFNFGPTPEGCISVQHLVERVLRAWGGGGWTAPENASTPQPHEANFLKLDIAKAAFLLNWRPLLSVSEAIDLTVAWYRSRHAQRAGFDALSCCREQLRQYVQRLTPRERQP